MNISKQPITSNTRNQKKTSTMLYISLASLIIFVFIIFLSLLRYSDLLNNFDKSENERERIENLQTNIRECIEPEALYEVHLKLELEKNPTLTRFILDDIYNSELTAKDDYKLARRLGLEKDTAEKQCKEAREQMSKISDRDPTNYITAHFFG